MIKKGTVKIVDRYKGSQLIEKVYKGSDLIFDAFSEISGNLPLSFNSRAEGAFKNYRVYGKENGAGVQTINLLDINATDASNGYVPNAYLNSSGEAIASGYYDVSEYIPVNSSTGYSYCGRKRNEPFICFYDSSKQFLSSLAYTYTRPRNFTTPSTAAYVRISIYDNRDMLLLGEYYETPDLEPFGYKIPLSISDGTNTSNYDLFIGPTKLGAEEYADYQEQKVYKRTDNMWNPAMNITAERYITSTGSISSKSENYSVSDYIPMSAETEYTISSITTVANAAAYHAFYDANQEVIETMQIGKANQSKTFTTPQNCAYARFTYRFASVSVGSIMLVEGGTLPETFIPYFQPTDPPAPLPAIIAYEGENTLDSTETVGEVVVKGRISETAMLGRPSL